MSPAHFLLSEVFFYWKVLFGTQCLPVIRNSEVSAIGSSKHIASTGIAVGRSTRVRYTEEVRYWEGPLLEVPL